MAKSQAVRRTFDILKDRARSLSDDELAEMDAFLAFKLATKKRE